MVVIYARDLDKSKLTDSFMGEGFEKKLEEAEEQGLDLVVGEFYKNEDWRIE